MELESESAVYAPGLDYDAITWTVWSETTQERVPDRSANYWSLMDADRLQFGPVDEETKRQVANHWLLVKSDNGRTADVIGSFSRSRLSGAPFLKQALVDLVEILEPGAHEFIHIPKVWDITIQSRVVHEKYYLFNVLQQIPCLDWQKSAVVTRKSRKGRMFYYVKGKEHVAWDLVQGKHIWRDTHCGTVFVSKAFKEEAQRLGAEGIEFRPVCVV